MVAKTDFMPALNGQLALNQTRKAFMARFVSNAGLAIITFFAVFSGLLASQENLETMGISLGPNHV